MQPIPPLPWRRRCAEPGRRKPLLHRGKSGSAGARHRLNVGNGRRVKGRMTLRLRPATWTTTSCSPRTPWSTAASTTRSMRATRRPSGRAGLARPARPNTWTRCLPRRSRTRRRASMSCSTQPSGNAPMTPNANRISPDAASRTRSRVRRGHQLRTRGRRRRHQRRGSIRRGGRGAHHRRRG